MARYKVILAYEGTQFQGYQRQANARTVQGVVETALRGLGWTGRSILAAGRTDTGVHAASQVISFDLDWRHSAEELRSALNASLPGDVAVQAIEIAADDFHPRYDASSRTYQYHIYCQEHRLPLLERHAWRVWPPVELATLQQAAASLVGTHDFAAFGTPPRLGSHTVRTIHQANWSESEAELIFEISADAFLYRMVRRLVSFQVEIGQGRRSLEELKGHLAMPPDVLVQGLAPSHGLVLLKVDYPQEARTLEKRRNQKTRRPGGLDESGEGERGKIILS